jgi:sucrose-6-phosphate hydrolase SacC (GH32 family)
MDLYKKRSSKYLSNNMKGVIFRDEKTRTVLHDRVYMDIDAITEQYENLYNSCVNRGEACSKDNLNNIIASVEFEKLSWKPSMFIGENDNHLWMMVVVDSDREIR